MIEVEIYRVYLTTEKERVRLTKAIAKQFPIAQSRHRVDLACRGQEAPKPICKVLAGVLDNVQSTSIWLVLVPNDDGLRWEYPATFAGEFESSVLKRGGWVDDLSTIPTVVL